MSTADRNAGSVFSGWSDTPPRWAIASGRGWSKYGCTAEATCEHYSGSRTFTRVQSDAWVRDRIGRFDESLADPRDLLGPVTIISELGCGPESSSCVDPEASLGLLVDEVVERTAAGVVEAVFGMTGLRGNIENYDDPRNSFIHEVLRRRTGIPITLGIVAIEVARRCEVDLVGIGFPGHFLIASGRELYDPFAAGRRLGEADVAELARRAGVPIPVPEWLLGPSARDEIVHRVLRNLTRLFAGAGDSEQLDWCLALRLVLRPDDVELTRQRAGVLVRRGEGWRAAELLDSLVARGVANDTDEAAAKSLRANLN